MDKAIVTLATMRRPVNKDKNLLLLPDVSPFRIMDVPMKEIMLFKGESTGPTPAPSTNQPTTSLAPTSEDEQANDDSTDDNADDDCGGVGLDGNVCDLTFDIVETERYVWLKTKLSYLQCCYPNFQTSSTIDTGDGDMVTLKINRYSLFVAAAVNMGILNTTSLTSTNYEYRDDDAVGDDGQYDDDYDYYNHDDWNHDDQGDDGGGDDEYRRKRLASRRRLQEGSGGDDKWDDEHYNYTNWEESKLRARFEIPKRWILPVSLRHLLCHMISHAVPVPDAYSVRLRQ